MDPTCDHDLLIEIHTNQKRMIQDIKDLGNNVSGRLDALEKSKADSDSVNPKLKDHEQRMRRLERYGSIAIGALAMIQFFMSSK